MRAAFIVTLAAIAFAIAINAEGFAREAGLGNCVCADRVGCTLQGCFANRCRYLCRQVVEGKPHMRRVTIKQPQ